MRGTGRIVRIGRLGRGDGRCAAGLKWAGGARDGQDCSGMVCIGRGAGVILDDATPARYCRCCKGVRPVAPDRPDWLLHILIVLLFPFWLFMVVLWAVLTLVWPNYCEGCGRMAGRAKRGKGKTRVASSSVVLAEPPAGAGPLHTMNG